MPTETTIRVNFGKAMPLFPLNKIVLMPHAIVPLYIFEERYRQMVCDALDGSGQIAMGVFQGKRWTQEYHGRPPLRPAVCIGQIVQHVKHNDGTYHIILQGVCRARIVDELLPEDDRLYRRAVLEPLGVPIINESALGEFRQRLTEGFDSGPLSELKGSHSFLEYLKGEEVPTSAILELITLTFLDDVETRYRLLAAGDAERRAEIINTELHSIEKIIRHAAATRPLDCPKGVHWN